ncbi:MAG: Asp23/Gls24 family envelope stress response protein [Clostridia bacterium]|nr:Asp23/Gls24 family envelope stress response protein [Clostridia bacterium]
MLEIKNHNGEITISQTVFANIVGNVINNCYGVVGMASKNTAEGIVSLLKKENYDKGVKVTAEGNNLIIDVHIIVSYGINLPAISGSISKEVKYIVEKMTGFKVKKVNVYIDAMKTN